MSGYPYPQPSGLPTVQGLYDVLRSGHRNLEPDRESADAITAVYPDIGGCLRKEHGFASRAVTWAAQRGVGQYIVAAAGMPAPQGLNVHEIARRVLPAARAVPDPTVPASETPTTSAPPPFRNALRENSLRGSKVASGSKVVISTSCLTVING